MSSTPSVDEREHRLRAMVAAGNIDQATEQAIRGYGSELVGWLRANLRNDADAEDAFSRLSEELWRSLHRYDGRCSIRTWCYMLARHAVAYVRSQPRHAREVLVSSVPSVLGAITEVLNTSKLAAAEQRDIYAEIREALDDEDQTLLVLRVDKNLSWREIAVVLCGEAAGSDEVERKAATLRKQFERVKEQLRALAAERRSP